MKAVQNHSMTILSCCRVERRMGSRGPEPNTPHQWKCDAVARSHGDGEEEGGFRTPGPPALKIG